MPSFLFRHSASLLLLASACGGSSASPITITHDAAAGDDGAATKEDAGHQGDASSAKDTGTTTHADAGADAEASGPRVYIRIKAVQTPEGDPGASAETPTDQNVAILGVTLLKDKNDPTPLVALALSTPIVTPYNDGSSTLLGSVAASALTSGTYTIVRIPVAYVRFTVAGTAHADGVSVPGDLTDAICLTSGSTIDGATRDRGWYSTTFMGGGQTFGPTTGEDSAIAQPGQTSHIGLDLSQAVAAYVFPLTLTIPSSITEDMEIVFTANTYEDFHWTDQTDPGYTTGVFDITAASYEPVTQLGANSATVSIGPVTTP